MKIKLWEVKFGWGLYLKYVIHARDAVDAIKKALKKSEIDKDNDYVFHQSDITKVELLAEED